MIQLKTSASKAIASFYTILHGLAVLTLIALSLHQDFSWALTLCLSIPIIMSANIALKKHYFYTHKTSILQANYERGAWLLTLQNQQIYHAILLKDSIHTQYFALLAFKLTASGQKITMIVLNDQPEQQMYRKFSLWWHEAHAS